MDMKLISATVCMLVLPLYYIRLPFTANSSFQTSYTNIHYAQKPF